MKSCERCKHWEESITMLDCGNSIGLCYIYKLQKYNTEGTKCAKFEEYQHENNYDNQQAISENS